MKALGVLFTYRYSVSELSSVSSDEDLLRAIGMGLRSLKAFFPKSLLSRNSLRYSRTAAVGKRGEKCLI